MRNERDTEEQCDRIDATKEHDVIRDARPGPVRREKQRDDSRGVVMAANDENQRDHACNPQRRDNWPGRSVECGEYVEKLFEAKR